MCCYRAWGVALCALVALGSCRSSPRENDPEHASGQPAAPAVPAVPAPAQTGIDRIACKGAPFASAIALREASGAAWVQEGDRSLLLVLSDSGGGGDAVEISPEDGTVTRTVRLPLDRAASDDIEGLSAVGDRIYGITSSGWISTWQRRLAAGGARYELVERAYPVADPEEQRHLPRAERLVCRSPHDTNCARNYEGLCLRTTQSAAAGECAGFAVSKTDGALYCLVFAGTSGRLAVDAGRVIRVAPGETLSGCDFDSQGDAIWVGSNLLGANRVYRLTGWRNPEGAVLEVIGSLGGGSSEAIAVGPAGAVYRFSDTNSSTSLVDKYICE